MSQHPSEPSGSHPYQPPSQGPTSSRPDGVAGGVTPGPGDQQETPHQPYDQQVPDSYTAPDPAADPYRQAPYVPGPQGQQGYGPSDQVGPGPQGYVPGAPDGSQGQPGYGQQAYASPQHGQPGPEQQAYATPRPAGPPAPPLSARDETLWAVLAHLSIPFFGFVGPLAVRLVHQDRSPWLRASAAEALNFSLVYTAAQVLSSLLVTVLIGAVLMPLVFLGGLVLCILAALAASRHEPYRYPVAVRLVS
jgi:uncharacterized Tic20 family protein